MLWQGFSVVFHNILVAILETYELDVWTLELDGLLSWAR